MEVIYDITDWNEKAVVATTGFFDGVHPGHRFLIKEMRRIALERNLPTAIITFSVHPRVVLQSDYQPRLLNSFEEKLELLSQTGIDYIIVMDFTPSLATLTAREFITEVLSKQWHVKTLLIGYDHRFGRSRSDGFDQYVIYGRECGMEVLNATSYGDASTTFSSSGVRQLLQAGDVAGAARILGYYYRLRGHVVDGYKIGRSIGFPTANIEVDEKNKVIPSAGSYAVWVVIEGKRYKGMLYIGPRPTLHDGGEISVEVNIFDFSGDVYDESVMVEFVDFIRKDMKFDDLDKLKAQIQADKVNAQCIMHHARLTVDNV